MSILYDLRATQPNEARFHGGGEYSKVVYQRLLEKKNNEKISAFYIKENKLTKSIKELSKRYEVNLFAIDSLADLRDLIINKGFNLLYTALPYSYYKIDLPEIKFICTLHGLRTIECPTDIYEYKYCNGWKEYAKYIFKQMLPSHYVDKKKGQIQNILKNVPTDTKIIVPSEHTKYSILSEFPSVSLNQLKVLYSPLKKLPKPESLPDANEILKKDNLESDNYFLLTSVNRFVKNGYRALKALDELYSSFDSIHQKVLVLGCDGNRNLKREIKNREKFIFKGYVSSDKLNLYYKKAFAFMYPTLNEGFGYPPLESMRYGTPVLGSAVSSVTEICGDAVLYFNPLSIREMKTRILRFIHDDHLRNEYKEKGIERYRKVSKKQDAMLDELCEHILGK